MKRLSKIFVAMVCAVALGGCRTDSDFGLGGGDNTLPTPDGEEQIIDGVPYSLAVKTSADATQEDFDASESTRTALDHLYKYYWAEGDKIGFSAVGATSKEVVFANNKLVNNQTGQRMSTIFDGVLPKEVYAQMTASQQYRYTAYYPYNADAVCDVNADGDLIIRELELPSVQTVSALGAEGFPTDYDFMVTTPVLGATLSTTNVNNLDFEFRHLFAAVQLNVTDDKINGGKEKVKKIVLTAPEGTPLTGKFNINTTTGEIEFVNPSNTVTVDMTAVGGMGKNDDCVWAIVNPAAINGLVELKVETNSGISYTYTYPKTKGYTQGVFNKVDFEIPTFNITADIYTSYSVKLKSGASAANLLHGSAIYFDNINIVGGTTTPDSKGGIYEMPYIESGVVCNNTREAFSKGATSAIFTCSSAAQWGEYDAQVYVKLADDVYVTSTLTTVQVTGIPFNRYVASNSYSSGGVPFDGSEGEGAMNNSAFPWTQYNMDGNNTAARNESYVVSPPFKVPSETSVKVHGWFSTSVTGSTLEVGPVNTPGAPSQKVGVSISNITVSEGAYYEFPSFKLTKTNNRVCIYDDGDSSGLFWDWPYFRIFKVAVLYAQ